eukprot:TRINITY_DN19864_c0_g1_i1.p1 TRINITY_DN19864_c0_g1~~TRINITY_DN19864_c0_g1_i1.p1  ORF type:complete len:1232 (+),score=296.07 TRINITY_DN19864_c0_g1_i1:69-3764(+)
MATVKIKISAARDLPIMDSQSHLTDAYVQVKHCDQTKKTRIAKRTLNPQWNESVTFDIADYAELQEDPFEVKVWDHDKWTADDVIGTVFLDLNVLLCTDQPQLAAWFPIFDSMRGLRGELFLSVHIKFMYGAQNANPFIPWIPECKDSDVKDERQEPKVASIAAETESVMIFAVSRLDPAIYRVVKVVGMVEELALRHDPEHARLQSLRSSRITNDQRILQFFKASGNVRRMLAKKTIEHGCNCILGFKEQYDLEPSGGNIIIRAYGTCCQISKVVKEDSSKSPTGSGPEDLLEHPAMYQDTRRRRHMRNLHQLMKENTKLLTIKSLPCNVVKRVGGVVSARSIKLITQLKTKAVVQERDSWWQEIREEIKANARHFCCNAVVGYTEATAFHEDICILSASGTAVIADWGAFMWPIPKVLKKQYGKQQGDSKKRDWCRIAHIPTTDVKMAAGAGENVLVKCLNCKKKPVPAFLLANMEIPPDMPVEGTPRLVEARYVKKKDSSSGESLAIEVSKALPHLEYNVHRELIHKVQKNGYNAAFGLRVDIRVGALFAIATATATAVHIPCLPLVHEENQTHRVLEVSLKSSVLNLDYFNAAVSCRISPKDRTSDLPEMTVELEDDKGSPTAGPGTSSPSESEDESSDSSSSSSNSSESSSQSGSEDHFAVSGSHNSRVKPYVVDIEEPAIDKDAAAPDDECTIINLDTFSASPVNLVPSHTITIQRRFEFHSHHSLHRINDLFKHMYSVLRHKVASQLCSPSDCVLASYKSEVSFASDNDINLRIMGVLLTPHNNSAWYKGSLSSFLSEMEQHHYYKRELHADGKVMFLRLSVTQMREGRYEKCFIGALKVHYLQDGVPTDFVTARLELKLDQPQFLRLPEPINVTEVQLQTNDDEPARDPYMWSIYGAMTKRGKYRLLVEESGETEMPLERNSWSGLVPATAETRVFLRRKGTSRGKLREGGHSPMHLPQDRNSLRGREGKKRLSGSAVEDFRTMYRCDSGLPPASPTRKSSPKRPKQLLTGLMTRPDEADDGGLKRQGTNTSDVFGEFEEFDPMSPVTKRKSKKLTRYSKIDKWETPYLQAMSPFCFSYDTITPAAVSPCARVLERGESYVMTQELSKGIMNEPDTHSVTITPMDYVAGASIVKYLGYLSHHFLRETEKVHSSNTYQGGLGTFFHYQTIEAHHVIRRIVHSMQGNALLTCNITQHVMLDSDESRAAYHFFTITGHIAQVHFER